MNTRVLDATEPSGLAGAVSEASGILRQGGLVAFPTETVYGLGANALDINAVAGIFHAKGRPADNPLIVHIANRCQMGQLAKNIPEEALTLAHAFWPGPLTLVLESREIVPRVVTGGLDSVGLRVPAHPVALALLRESGLPLAAPSANLSGRPSPTTSAHVLDDLDGRIDAVLDGGPCGVGVESTVLDIRGGRPLLLRPGGVTPAQIERVLGRACPVAFWSGGETAAPPSPGLKYVHYAPQAPLWLVRGGPDAVQRMLKAMRDDFASRGQNVGLLLSAETAAALGETEAEVLGSRDEPDVMAANLYAALRRFDARGTDVILAEGFSDRGMGLALMNRLVKAAGPRLIEAE